MNNDLSIKPNSKDTFTERLAALSPAKRALLEQRLTKNKGSEAYSDQTIPRRANHDAAPLSFAQQRLWFLQQLEPDSPFYHMTKAMQLNGTLNVNALQQALDTIVARHEVLRTTLVSVDGNPKQFIAESRAVELPVIVVEKGKKRIEQQAEIQRLNREEGQRLFNLSSDLMLRATLLRLEPTEHILILVMHHIASDGWSMGILFRELSALYKAFTTDQSSPLAPLPIQYADYAHWQRQWLTGDLLETQLDYWKQQLAGAPALLEFPTDYPRPPIQRFQGKMASLQLSPELTAQLKTLSQQAGTTLFMTLLAAFATLLSRYSGQSDIIIGSPIANRTHHQTESLIGLFLNTLVLRIDLSGNPRVDELLRRIRQVALDAYAHQDIPFEKLVEELQPERSLSHSPLFQVMLVFQNTPTSAFELDGITLTPLKNETLTTKFDLNFHWGETPQGLWGNLFYNSELFNKKTITWMLGQFQTLLENLVTAPEKRLSSLRLLTETERHHLSTRGNLVHPTNPFIEFEKREQTLPARFEQQVRKSPEQIAVKTKRYTWTYRDLNDKANQVAQALLEPAKEERVALLFEPEAPMLVGIMGVLKAGKTYVPLDPDLPRERLEYLVQDSQASAILTNDLNLSLAQALTSNTLRLINLDEIKLVASRDEIQSTLSADSIAYILYTSGSTGQPKGVLQNHRNVLHFIRNYTNNLHITTNDKLTLLSSFSFDAAIMDIFGALLNGATLYPVNLKEESLSNLSSWLIQQEVTLYHSTPTVYRHWLNTLTEEKFPKIRLVVLGGEAVEQSEVEWYRNHFATDCFFVNLFGSTESSINSFNFINQQTDTTRHAVSVGYSIEETEILLLNEAGEETDIYGEIAIKSPYLALGYWQKPEITQAVFLTDDDNQRLYRTGDMGRLRADGSIEFVGRKDFQVKLRGFRIELGEIEAVLSQHPAVQETVVMLMEEPAGEKRLVAYWVPNQAPATDTIFGGSFSVSNEKLPPKIELRRFIQEKLPDYMIPSAFVQMEAMPLTPTGKIDRRALQLSVISYQLSKQTFVAPQTPEEELLAGIWADVLGVERVGIFDNFFELGGHSLLATQVMSRVRETFSVELPLRHLFESPTIAGLNEHLKVARCDQSLPPITPLNRDQPQPLSFAQQRLWFLEQLEGSSATYNIPAARRLEGQLNRAALEQSLQTLVQRHETLRTTFQMLEEQPVQVIYPVEHWSLSVVDLQDLNAEKQEREIQRLVNEEAQRPFDLSIGPLFRATLLQKNVESHILMLTMHHIISDGWSIGILNRELSTLYNAISKGQPFPLPPLPIQYADFAHWQRQWLTGDVLETQLYYWKKQLAGAPALLELPTDHPRPPIQRFQGKTASLQLSPELTEQLKNLSQQAGSTLYMTLLAAFATLLSRYSGQSDIVIGSPIANRIHRQIESLIGFFVNTLVLRIDLSNNPRFEELLRRVRQVALDAYTHQDIPFEKLVEELQPERNISHTPLFQVMFVLQNAQMDTLQLSALSLTPIARENVTAKFDLTLSMRETAQGLAGRLEYNTDLFEPATITRMVGHFQTLLEGIVKSPQQPIAELPLLTETEYQQLMAWNDTATDYPVDQCIHQLFEAQVDKTPDAVAVVFEGQQLTYRELNNKANQLAHHLQTIGVKPEELVSIYIERSYEMIIGLLGILKAGGAYLPLDPAYPAARLAFMLEDAGVGVLLTQSSLVKELPKTTFEDKVFVGTYSQKLYPRKQVVCLDTERKRLSSLSTNNLASRVAPSNLAYVIYTSGSTGKPKGVAVPHRAVNRLVFNTNYINIEPSDRIAQASNVSFDAATFEIWGALLHGARLVGVTKDIILSPQDFAAYLREQEISVIFLTTALFNQLAREVPTAFQSVRHVLFGGEAVEPKWVAQILKNAPPQRLLHVYGPTESTTFTTWHLVEEVPEGATNLPIGRPIANTQVYLLDQNRKPVPIGVPGELHIGGAGLARGYLNRPDLTADKFIPNPFSKDPDSRLYKTGDLARYLPDGNIEFIGRLDNQVKIRGFRIELGEIEAVLAQHPTVQENVIIVHEKPSHDKRLVAYLVPKLGQVIDKTELRGFFKDRLPDYMIPSTFVPLEAMPLTPNGKIDRRALPAPETVETKREDTFITPHTLTEEMLARIWVDILGIESLQHGATQINIHDNFFDIGGHSLFAARLIDQVRKVFQIELPLRRLFEFPTIAELAKCIETELHAQPQAKCWSSLVPIQVSGSKKPFFIVPGGGGSESEFMVYAKLVYLLGHEQPVYGLQAHGLDGEQVPHTQVETMATEYLKEIRAFQPEGPYLLGGECIGGRVAFEMAQQLQAQGQKVGLLVLIDTVYLSGIDYVTYLVYRILKIRQIRQNWKTLLELEPHERLPYLFDKAKKTMWRFIAKFHLNSVPSDHRIQQVKTNYQKTLRRYRPKPYYGRMVLLATEANYEKNSTLGWETLAAGGLEIYKLPGDHSSYLGEQVQATAKQLKACLDEAQTEEVQGRTLRRI